VATDHATVDAQATHGLLLKLMAFRGARALQLVAQIGIADLLRDGPQSVEQLAQATGTHPPSLYRVLRTAAAQGIMEERTHQLFAQNEESSYLLSDHPSCLRYQAMMLGAEYDMAATQDMDYSLRTGKSAIQKRYGTDIWDYLATRPAESQVYNQAMTALSLLDTLPILRSYDFSALRTLVDIGGGHGFFLFNLLTHYPGLHGTLLDRPQVIAEIDRKTVDAQRCTLLAGNMFTDIPAGADAYFMKHILHDWGDEAAIALLRKCRDALGRQSKLLIAEVVMPPTGAGLLESLFDLSMLVKQGEGAHERTEAEYRALLSASGFATLRVMATAGSHSIIEAHPAY
jgi:hypothetical protein